MKFRVRNFSKKAAFQVSGVYDFPGKTSVRFLMVLNRKQDPIGGSTGRRIPMLRLRAVLTIVCVLQSML
jgi:hypothetical protein